MHEGKNLRRPRPARRGRRAIVEVATSTCARSEEWPRSLVADLDGNVDFLEEAGQDLDNGDKDQVMKRSRVGDNNPHLASKAQASQGGAFTLEIFHGVIQPNFMSLQEPVESVASLKPKKLPQLCLRQPASLESYKTKTSKGE